MNKEPYAAFFSSVVLGVFIAAAVGVVFGLGYAAGHATGKRLGALEVLAHERVVVGECLTDYECEVMGYDAY